MTTGRRAELRSLALATVFLGAAIGSACRRAPTIATALEVAGTAERSHGDETWNVALPGTSFAIGDTLRTGAASLARLGLVGGGVIRVGENARLRFQRGALVGQQAPDIAVDLGSAEVEETPSEVSIVTAVGAARLERGARVRVRADGRSTSLEVVVGRAVMLESGQEVSIDAGHGVRIHLGSSEIQRFALTVGDAVVEEKSPPRDAGSAATDGQGAARAEIAEQSVDGGGASASPETPPKPKALSGGEGPPPPRPEAGRADITLEAGETATVHDGRPVAAVRLRTEEVCPGDAIVELGGHGHRHERFTGSGAVVVRLKPGTRPYKVRCASDGSRAKTRASGVISLRRDTGDVPLARRAPLDVIDADGRHYTVLFQTRLPLLTLAWSAAEAGDSQLELHVGSTDGERVIQSASPRRPLPAGTLREGTYTLWYRTSSGKQSPKTTVSVRFDNAAPTAQFFRASYGTEKGTPHAIAIDGVTVDGAKVSVGGRSIAVDAHGRFRTEAFPLGGDEAVAVRLEHPRTGVHYYVRRRTETR